MEERRIMILFVPIKENSQRVPAKNFRDFGGVELYKHTLYKFSKYEVYVDTDSEEIIEEIEKDPKLSHVTSIRRKEHLLGNEVSVCDLIYDFVLDKEIKDPIVQLHVTSPFLREKTIEKASRMIGEYDSVVSCNRIQTRLWRKENYGYCPVNHNPIRVEQTQDLPILYEENSAFYIFTPDVLLETGNRVGKDPFFFHLTFPENIDIDEEEDFRIAELLFNEKSGDIYKQPTKERERFRK